MQSLGAALEWSNSTACPSCVSAEAVTALAVFQPRCCSARLSQMPWRGTEPLMDTGEDAGPIKAYWSQQHQRRRKRARGLPALARESNAVGNSWREDTCYKIVVFESVSRKHCQPVL